MSRTTLFTVCLAFTPIAAAEQWTQLQGDSQRTSRRGERIVPADRLATSLVWSFFRLSGWRVRDGDDLQVPARGRDELTFTRRRGAEDIDCRYGPSSTAISLGECAFLSHRTRADGAGTDAVGIPRPAARYPSNHCRGF